MANLAFDRRPPHAFPPFTGGLAFTVFVAFTAACTGAARAPVPVIQTVSAGCSGGFTGGGNHTTLTRDGSLYSVRQVTAGTPSESTLVRQDTALARDVFARLDEMRFLEINFSEPSNMTCSVSVRADTLEHAVAWGINTDAAPKAVRDVFDLLTKK
jgi:hypothetical protein